MASCRGRQSAGLCHLDICNTHIHKTSNGISILWKHRTSFFPGSSMERFARTTSFHSIHCLRVVEDQVSDSLFSAASSMNCVDEAIYISPDQLSSFSIVKTQDARTNLSSLPIISPLLQSATYHLRITKGLRRSHVSKSTSLS